MALRIFLLPSKAIANLKQLPEQSGVYYMTALWHIFYVGKATNLRKRLTPQHRRYGQLRILSPFARLHYQVLPKEKISAFEKAEIQSLKPDWNYTKVLKSWGLLKFALGFWLRFWLGVALVAIFIGYLTYVLILQKK